MVGNSDDGSGRENPMPLWKEAGRHHEIALSRRVTRPRDPAYRAVARDQPEPLHRGATAENSSSERARLIHGRSLFLRVTPRTLAQATVLTAVDLRGRVLGALFDESDDPVPRVFRRRSEVLLLPVEEAVRRALVLDQLVLLPRLAQGLLELEVVLVADGLVGPALKGEDRGVEAR